MVDKKFIVQLQGKDFITHEGLLDEFHKNGGNKITTEFLSNVEGLILFKATARGERGVFTAHGDADDNNVGGMVAKHKVRMAETRAINRALRLYNNIGMCSSDEIGGDDKPTPKANEELNKSVEVPLVCADCSKPITEAVKNYSVKFFNKTLCRSCQEKTKK